jgi:hypothetical protein
MLLGLCLGSFAGLCRFGGLRMSLGSRMRSRFGGSL